MRAMTMFDKIWNQHVVSALEDGTDLIYIDRVILHEMLSAKAYADLRATGRQVRRPDLALAVMSHALATDPGRNEFTYAKLTPFIQAHRKNARDFGVPLFDVHDAGQGIVHVVGPESGFTLPGTTLVCCDSHTCTNGGVGSLAFGVGSSDLGHILATQTLALRRPKTLRVKISGQLPLGVYAKDIVLHLISRVGAGGGNGYAVEYAGEGAASLSVEARLTLCNMSVEWGGRMGMVAPDDVTYQYIAGRQFAPQGKEWDLALAAWRQLPSDPDARFDKEVAIDCSTIAPQVTWGTSPQDAVSVDQPIPDPAQEPDADRRAAMVHSMQYMDVKPGMRLEGLPIHKVFIGSCTNARLSDLRVAAGIAAGRKVAPGIRAMVVPGSSTTKRDAEAEGLDRIFKAAGFEWHESACSMCAAVNADSVAPFERCVSTSNRNYEGRQGRDARTHLASPAMAAAAAVTGRISDVRKLSGA